MQGNFGQILVSELIIFDLGLGSYCHTSGESKLQSSLGGNQTDVALHVA